MRCSRSRRVAPRRREADPGRAPDRGEREVQCGGTGRVRVLSGPAEDPYAAAYTRGDDPHLSDLPLSRVSGRVEVVVIGRHTDVPSELRAATEEKVGRLTRFANYIRRVEVDFDESRNNRVSAPHSCEILVHLKGQLVKGHGAGGEPQAALDLAIEKVELQMRRLHGRRTARRASRRDGGPGHAARDGELPTAGLLAPLPGEQDHGIEAEAGDPDGEALIVKSKRFTLKPMSAEEAALQMELLGHDFFLFTSSENGRASVIYRRNDGHLGLIEAAG